MSFDYRKLKGRIKELYNTQDNFSKALGLGRTSLSQRLNNYLEFSQDEIYKSCELLELDLKEIPEYFFKLKV